VCNNKNERPGYNGMGIWKNSIGDKVATGVLEFIANEHDAGFYICSVPAASTVDPVKVEVKVHCKLFCGYYTCITGN